jgi:hypothetical protein
VTLLKKSSPDSSKQVHNNNNKKKKKTVSLGLSHNATYGCRRKNHYMASTMTSWIAACCSFSVFHGDFIGSIYPEKTRK